MAKCDCYFQHGTKFLCYGTKEMEECSCGGDENKCNFYPEKRKRKMANEKLLIPEFGRRYNFPENMHIEHDGLSGNIVNEIAAQMVEKYDGFVADQIAMEARASGVSDVTILNKAAIMNALKKQIPQKVVLNEIECLCPACRYDMMGLWDYPDVQDPNYCPICGQKLKWRTNDGR